jgi:magnesium transporter
MIRTLAFTNDSKIVRDIPLHELASDNIQWFWVDFNTPTEDENKILEQGFSGITFHPLALEDCFHYLQRPKLDYYDGYTFFTLHSLDHETITAHEVDLFYSEKYVVTYHMQPSREIEYVWQRVQSEEKARTKGTASILHGVCDKLVDEYFPIAYQIEDRLNELENNDANKPLKILFNDLFGIRGQLLKLRKSTIPMRDLLYRILNSEHLEVVKDNKLYFTDIHDHLLKLAGIIESSMFLSADIRDSYMALTSNKQNSIMTVLTVVSTIFIPLTFLVGVYGMNFENIPELHTRYGYFVLWIVMIAIAVGMYIGFRKKGWFSGDF